MKPALKTTTFVVHDIDGQSKTFQSERFPWEYKTFLAYVDPSTGNYAYIPMANIDHFEVVQ